MIRRSFILTFLFLLLTLSGFGQDNAAPGQYYVEAQVIDGDTVPMVVLEEATVSERRRYRSRKYQRVYDRLKDKVVEVYPYAKVAGMLFEEYDKKLSDISTEAQRKYYMKQVEKELKAEFKGEITNLTVSEGRILIRLIDRETGKTSFRIIEDMRGGFSAFFWQSIARVFGSDLKENYNPRGQDRIIEDIVLDIEMGKVDVPERTPRTERVQKVIEESEDRGRWWKLNS